MKKIFCLLLIAAFTLPGCEKDDLCDANTNTTPRVVIEFYDTANRATLKTVSNLKVIAEGMPEAVVFNPAGIGEGRYVTTASNIKLPLNTGIDTVKYLLTINSGNENPAFVNTDTLQFNYSRHNVFISRACGYSTFFQLSNGGGLDPFILNDNSPDGPDAWIKDVDVQTYSLISENETHIKIYF